METSGLIHKKALHSKTEQPLATTRVVLKVFFQFVANLYTAKSSQRKNVKM